MCLPPCRIGRLGAFFAVILVASTTTARLQPVGDVSEDRICTASDFANEQGFALLQFQKQQSKVITHGAAFTTKGDMTGTGSLEDLSIHVADADMRVSVHNLHHDSLKSEFHSSYRNDNSSESGVQRNSSRVGNGNTSKTTRPARANPERRSKSNWDGIAPPPHWNGLENVNDNAAKSRKGAPTVGVVTGKNYTDRHPLEPLMDVDYAIDSNPQKERLMNKSINPAGHRSHHESRIKHVPRTSNDHE